jgi:hypothetical protein
VEINASIKGGGNIFIVNAGGGGGIKLQLTWEPEQPKSS